MMQMSPAWPAQAQAQAQVQVRPSVIICKLIPKKNQKIASSHVTWFSHKRGNVLIGPDAHSDSEVQYCTASHVSVIQNVVFCVRMELLHF